MIKNQKIIDGIREYKKERELLKRVIKRNDNKLDQNKFDRVFGDFKYIVRSDGTTVMKIRRMKMRFMGIKGETIILGGGLDFGSQLKKWIHLAQLMYLSGELDIKEIDDLIVYSVKE